MADELNRQPDMHEKDFQEANNGNGYHMNDMSIDNDTALKRIRTAGSISISPELFEKIYLSPQNQVKGDLRKIFGNPTPVALLGFLLCLSPLSCTLMGWRGAGGSGAANEASYFFFGGVLMLLGGLLEFFLGNTFPFVVFTSFGAFWLTFGGTLQPFFNSMGAYAAAGDPAASGAMTPTWNATFGFFHVFMGLLDLVYLICSLRTNICFVIIFLTLTCAFGCLAGAYWNAALAFAGDTSHAKTAQHCQKAAGALTFVTCMSGWWIFAAIMLASIDFPFQLPVGDLSTMITGASEKAKRKENMV